MLAARTQSKIKNQKSKIARLVPALLDWFAQNARDLPWRRTRDPYAIWVSEIMLQQTQVKTVVPYWEHWMRELPDIECLAKAGPEKIHKLWEGLGYYSRVRNLQKAAQLILERHGGRFPETFEEVLALPGIGRYTAGAICSIAFNQPTPVLDGNVIRVLTRVFGIDKNPREKKTNAALWHTAEELVAHASRIMHHPSRIPHPAKMLSRTRTRTRTKGDMELILGCSHLNQSLMELGAVICTSRQPNCNSCPIALQCVALRQQCVEQLPKLGRRTASTSRRFVAFVVRRNGRFLVRQRPAGVVNAHLWEFPNVEITARADHPDLLGTGFQTISPSRVPGDTKPFCTIKHSITRYRITLEAFAVRQNHTKKFADPNSRWLTLPGLKKLSFPSAHKKIIACLDQLD